MVLINLRVRNKKCAVRRATWPRVPARAPETTGNINAEGSQQPVVVDWLNGLPLLVDDPVRTGTEIGRGALDRHAYMQRPTQQRRIRPVAWAAHEGSEISVS